MELTFGKSNCEQTTKLRCEHTAEKPTCKQTAAKPSREHTAEKARHEQTTRQSKDKDKYKEKMGRMDGDKMNMPRDRNDDVKRKTKTC